jgi:hypothetical protein
MLICLPRKPARFTAYTYAQEHQHVTTIYKVGRQKATVHCIITRLIIFLSKIFRAIKWNKTEMHGTWFDKEMHKETVVENIANKSNFKGLGANITTILKCS